MALNRQKTQDMRNGELYVAANTTYIGGQPCAINSSGDLTLCTSGNVASYAGVFANNNTTDGVTATVRAKGTRYFGNSILIMERELVSGSYVYPFDSAQTWNPGDALYIDANGKWTNQVVSGQDSFGTVLAVTGSGPSTAIEVQFYR